MTQTPPKPLFALSVGIVGHRPNRLPESAHDEVTAQTCSALRLVREAAEAACTRHAAVFAHAPVNLRLISALAEGADRVAANAALEEGYSLACVLPFGVNEYERDFVDAASRAHYRALLDKSEAVLVLPGDRVREAHAYEAAGQTLVDNADILLTVWDGGGGAGRGGTTELIKDAARHGLPIIHIDAAGQAPPRLLWWRLGEHSLGERDLDDMPASPLPAALDHVVDLLTRPPEGGEGAKLEIFLQERWQPVKSLPVRIVMPLMQALIGLRRPRWRDIRLDPPGKLAEGFARDVGHSLEKFVAQTASYGWADALGVYYAQTFRGAYIANFVLAALAVLMAAGSLIGTQIARWEKWPFVLVEVVFIAGILAITITGRFRDWHGRWLEAREVAERLRAAVPLWLLGVRATGASGPEPAWTGWYVRAHLRGLGPRTDTFDTDRLTAMGLTLQGIVDGQCAYHSRNARLMHKVEHRVERIGEVLFGVTLIVALAYLIGVATGIPTPTGWSYWVTALTAGLPALAAATYGIRLIGDFSGGERRSRRTEEALLKVRQALQQGPKDLAHLRAAAAASATAMLGDVEHWRLTSETRELAIPG